MSDRILIAEISGKRPGTKKQRPTEKFESQHDWVIISNNSEGYETDLPIINVPDDYREWYCANIKNSDTAWYAPMNRSYAIKWAREQGYDYLVQLDDNITTLLIDYYSKQGDVVKRYHHDGAEMLDDFIKMFVTVMRHSNAAMVGAELSGVGIQGGAPFLRERYVYSIFALNLKTCPNIFQGDFEDDIEYRLKCRQMGMPVLQVVALKYIKTSQGHNKDLSGNRAAYFQAGLKRGEHMSKLYGDVYKAKMTSKTKSVMARDDGANINFKHILKPFKVGVVVYDMKPIIKCFKEILSKYAEHKPDKSIFKIKKRRKAKA